MDGITGLDRTMALLRQVLNLYTFRQSVISANIANVDTPGYQPFDVVFEDKLRAFIRSGMNAGLAGTHPRHFSDGGGDRTVEPTLVALEPGVMGSVAGGVDIDREMSKLSEVALRYSAAAQLLAKKFQLVKYVIDGGGPR